MSQHPPVTAPVSARPWQRRLGWFAVWAVTLLVLFYAFENWRGARAWSALVAELQAQGESLDPATLIPPPAADSENFGALPLFRPLFDFTVKPAPSGRLIDQQMQWTDAAGKEALEKIRVAPPMATTPRVTWHLAQPLDLAAWQRFYETQPGYPHPATPGTPAEDVLVALKDFDAPLDQLRAGMALPRSRFPLRYQDHIAMALPHISVLRGFAEVAHLRAVAGLEAGRTGEAFADTQLVLRLCDASSEEPLLISVLVQIANLEYVYRDLWEGLARHAWSEPQLAAFEKALASQNLIARLQAGLRGERQLCTLPAMNAIKANPAVLLSVDGRNSAVPFFWFARLGPTGWMDETRATMGRSFSRMLACVDPAQRRIDLAKARLFIDDVESGPLRRKSFGFIAQLFSSLLDSLPKAVESQANLNLARWALALERHRLRHAEYPASIAQLDPDVRPGLLLPVGPADGQPVQYQPNSDDSFQLTFTGWPEGLRTPASSKRRNGTWPPYSILHIKVASPR